MSLLTAGTSKQDLAEEMFRLAVEACPSGMLMVDQDGRMVMVNSKIEEQFGYRREELIGQPIDILVPERLRRQHIRHRDHFAHQPATRQIGAGRDLVALRKDGTEFPAEIGLNPIRVGDELLVLSVIVDISERKRMGRLKDEFVSTVSHELRTPLTSISGSLGLLTGQWSGKLPESAARLLMIAHKNCQRLVRLINDILDIEKIESGKVVFKFSKINLRPLVEQVIEDSRGFAESFGVNIQLVEAVDCHVNADPDRLAQVVTNLVSNAIKFSPRSEEVLVAIERRADRFRISVRDYGPGIPAEFKPHIFEKFAQADATSAREKGGTGLGLSIVKQIVERLSGEVGFDDAPDGGTIFYVDLPAWDAPEYDVDAGAPADAAHLLLCGNEREATADMREQLRPYGFAVDFVYTPTAAVSRSEAMPYTAILVDLDMPANDNIGLIYELRTKANCRDTPIIVMSSDPNLGRDDARSPRLDILQWLVKPIDHERLAQTIRVAIAQTPEIRPSILHVDDDYDVLAAVTLALKATADVLSVDSLEAARATLATDRIDLAVLDISLGAQSGLDLLPDLRDARGHPIPVIIFSAGITDLQCDEQIQANLVKSASSIDGLVATIRDRLARLPTRATEAA